MSALLVFVRCWALGESPERNAIAPLSNIAVDLFRYRATSNLFFRWKGSLPDRSLVTSS
jgi:hypothetical protein